MATEQGQSLERSVAVRGAHRGVLTRLIKEAEQILLGVEEVDLEKACERLHTLNGVIQEKGKLLQSLDENILDKIKLEEIEREVIETSSIVEKVMEVRRKIDNFVKKNIRKTSLKENIPESLSQSLENSDASNNVQAEVIAVSDTDMQSDTDTQGNTDTQVSTDTQANTNTGVNASTENHPSNQLSEGLSNSINIPNQNDARTTHEVRVARPKLPKLCLPKFKGDVKKWHAFWELFESLIHKNEEMSQIDKFNYMSTLLEKEAARAIQGLSLTSANYTVAIDILQERFGKPQTVITAHMDDLLKLPTLMSICRVKDLRAVLDQLTIHVRGLQSLGISAQQYGSLLTPIVMSKLPPDVRLLVTRKAQGSLLELGGIMEMLKVEVEAREASFSLKTQDSNLFGKGSWERGQNHGIKSVSTAAFVTNSSNQSSNIKCAFCSKQHFSASCDNVKDIGKRREILMKERRCFLCLKRGHRASECNRPISCRKCNRRHHQSICNLNKAAEDQVNPEGSERVQDNSTTISAANFTKKSNVVLQTATAMARCPHNSEAVPVHILFDGGS